MRDDPVQDRFPDQRFGVCREEGVNMPEVLLALVIRLHLYDGLRHIGAGCECCGVKTFLSKSTRSTGEKNRNRDLPKMLGEGRLALATKHSVPVEISPHGKVRRDVAKQVNPGPVLGVSQVAGDSVFVEVTANKVPELPVEQLGTGAEEQRRLVVGHAWKVFRRIVRRIDGQVAQLLQEYTGVIVVSAGIEFCLVGSGKAAVNITVCLLLKLHSHVENNHPLYAAQATRHLRLSASQRIRHRSSIAEAKDLDRASALAGGGPQQAR